MTESMPMVVSDPLAAFERSGMIKMIAPAKVNLFLGIGDLRADGYHEVITVMHALSLHDVLHLDYFPESEGGLYVEVTALSREGLSRLEIKSEDNLVYKAINLLAKNLQRDKDETIKVRIEKHIPPEGGLGGGSSDAAAALIGAASLWGLDSTAPEVIQAATQLGSDIVFFLYGGSACFEGKGDVFRHALEPMKGALAIIKPEKGVSTGMAYQKFNEYPEKLSEEVAQRAVSTLKAQEIPLYNNLNSAALSVLPELANINDWLREQNEAQEFLLCGSGSSTFVLCESFESACILSAKAQLQGWWARTTTFSPLRSAIVPR